MPAPRYRTCPLCRTWNFLFFAVAISEVRSSAVVTGPQNQSGHQCLPWLLHGGQRNFDGAINGHGAEPFRVCGRPSRARSPGDPSGPTENTSCISLPRFFAAVACMAHAISCVTLTLTRVELCRCLLCFVRVWTFPLPSVVFVSCLRSSLHVTSGWWSCGRRKGSWFRAVRPFAAPQRRVKSAGSVVSATRGTRTPLPFLFHGWDYKSEVSSA